MNFEQEPLLPASHINIELSSNLNEPDNSLEDCPLLDHHHQKPKYSNLTLTFTKLSLLRIADFLIKFLILLGQKFLLGFDGIMYIFRYTPRMKFFFSISTPTFNLLQIIGPKKSYVMVISVIMLTICFLAVLSLIYFWLNGKKDKTPLSGHDDEKISTQPDEPLNELGYKTASLQALLDEAKARTDEHGNIPNDLAIRIVVAHREVVTLSNDLYVSPELLLNGYGDESGFTRQQINVYPVEKYAGSLCEMDEPEACSLCIKEFKEKQELRKLSCTHRFHKKCIDDWLTKLGTCPNCKIDLKAIQDPADADADQ